MNGPLECHEVYLVDYKRGRSEYLRTEAICRDCHLYIHRGFMLHCIEIGKIPFQTAMMIETRCGAVRGYRNLPRLPDTIAPWDKWVLVINGVEYPSVLKSPEDWEKMVKEVDV
jgi:hypothetical protein